MSNDLRATLHRLAREILARDGDFGDGAFTVVSDCRLLVCPPLCLDGDSYVITWGDSYGALGTHGGEVLAQSRRILGRYRCKGAARHYRGALGASAGDRRGPGNGDQAAQRSLDPYSGSLNCY